MKEKGSYLDYRGNKFNLRVKLFFYLFLCLLFFQVNVSAQDKPPVRIQASLTEATGVVTDTKGETLPGVSIRVKGTNMGSNTDINGNFRVPIMKNAKQTILIFSYVGMETIEVAFVGKPLKIVMKEGVELSEVVVSAGIIHRNKMGFTGAYTSVTGGELKAIGNQNILQSMGSLDPSFAMIDNNLGGSNPNLMPNIEIRGQTSLDINTVQKESSVSPNAPLFVIDGFIATQEEVNDLDMNRVASLILLKDAGSTAIYGSKGANGVIVIETVKPELGKLMVRYNGDLNLSFADLSGYNLMNAHEKLEFELLAERYGKVGSLASDDLKKMALYNQRLANVAQGVDTYWIKEPIRTGIYQKHSLTVSGNNDQFSFVVGANYGKNQGVLKEDFRETFGGNIRLNYRVKKMNITNNLIISGSNSEDSPYAPFSNFARANPYYTKTKSDGEAPKYLEMKSDGLVLSENIPNPLYNALLDSKSSNNYLMVTNNTNINWYPIDNLAIMAALSIKREMGDKTTFVDPDDTRYAEVSYKQKGNYTNLNHNNWGYDANISANYNKLINKVHSVTLIGRSSITQSNRSSKMFEATGFPSGSNGVPSFADSYKLDSRPGYTEFISRSVNVLGAFNYNYKYRYLFDASYTIEGSNTFGSNKNYASFWSLGAGWNLQKEAFAKDWKWLSDLRIRVTYGTTANQNLQLITSSVYKYYSGRNIFGQGAYLSRYGNPNLEWQKVNQFSLNLDAAFLDNRLKMQGSVYTKRTDPLVVSLDQKPSTGISSYPANLGFIKTNGVEFMVSYSPIYNIKERIILNLRASGARNVSKYDGFGNTLNNLNNDYLQDDKLELSQRSLEKYQDGRSPNDLWAVRSLGIDPASGKEIFLKKDGVTTTLKYAAEDRVVVGNSRPKLEGTFGLSFTYKRLEVGLVLRYRFGGYLFNNALYNKVENITAAGLGYNQDKRALYDRWKNPGDIAQFKSIKTSGVYEVTPMSSRFIQQDNTLSGESIRLSWDFSRDTWLKSLKMSELKFTAYMNDIFRISSVKAERGIEYPFARTIAFSLSTRF